MTHRSLGDFQAGFLQLRSGLVIYPPQSQEIEKALHELAQNTPTEFILLTDTSGQVIATHGNSNLIGNPVALGSLVASDVAASSEIARMLGEYNAYHIVLREGEQKHTFIAEAGPHMALLANVGTDTPLGWARMQILKTAQRLAAIVADPPEEFVNQEPLSPQQTEERAPEEDIVNLFGDALNALWSEEKGSS